MGGYVKRVIDMLPKLSADEVKKLLKAVASENNMLDSIIESLSTGLVIVDKSWKILQMNKAANRLLFSVGLDENKIDSEPVWNVLGEKEIAEWLKHMAETQHINVREEFTTTNSDGSVRFLAISVLSFIQQTQISGNIIRIEDITQQKNQDVLCRRMENMAGLTNLAAGMAHDIKNPLGAMSIHLQLIQKAIQKKRDGDGMLPDKKFLEDHLDIVDEEIQKLNSLVMDFLFAVRPVNARLALSDPNDIIKGIAETFTPEFNSSHVDFKLNLMEEKKRILIDEKLFRQVLINIAQNGFAAIKSRFPECDGPESEEIFGKLEISTYLKNDKYLVVITDNGCGMNEETVARVFEPYFTTKANGTGLGMTMAYKIIKEFNGDIHVASEVNKGTKFTISIPIPQTETKLLG